MVLQKDIQLSKSKVLLVKKKKVFSMFFVLC